MDAAEDHFSEDDQSSRRRPKRSRSRRRRALLWDEGFFMLKAFRKRHRSLDVPHDNSEYQDLYDWIGEQRNCYQHQLLSAQQKRQLESIGFVWDPQQASTTATSSKGEEDRSQEGDGNRKQRSKRSIVKTADASAPLDSGSDAMSIDGGGGSDDNDDKKLLKKLRPAKHRKEELENEKWIDAFQQLKDFRKKHGPTRPLSVRQHNFLYRWCQRQRSHFHRNKLPTDRQALLDSLPYWEWVVGTNQQEEAEDDSEGDSANDGDLVMDVSHPRTRHQRGPSQSNAVDSEVEADADNEEEEEDSSDEEESEYNTPVKDAEYYEKVWMKNYNALKAYKKKHGDTLIPSRGKLAHLYRWKKSQRRMYREKRIRSDRKQLLDKLDSDWNDTDEERRWWEKYDALKVFKKKYGHIDVPAEEKGLANWIFFQKRKFRERSLPTERKLLLKKLEPGFFKSVGGSVKRNDDDAEEEEEDEEEEAEEASPWWSCIVL